LELVTETGERKAFDAVAMASEQLTRDVITLKGSAAIVSEFLLYSGM